MRAPEFWKADVSGRDAVPMLRALLTPVAWAYAEVAARRNKSRRARQAPVPVICVGNLTVGGAGKTPITRAIRARLGAHAHTLSRGYGGRLAGPLRVTPDMDAREVGDEPLLHAADGPAWISRDRFAGAMAAASAGAHAIIMDDGFQNPALAKDLSILAIDAGYGIGNGKVFPAGPLRERLGDGLARADAIILMGDDSDRAPWLEAFEGPVLRARIVPIGAAPDGPLVAFAGLARPEKFFDTLAAAGAELEETLPFPDHHIYDQDDLDLIARFGAERGARLITTEKDAARLTPEWRARVLVLPVEAQFSDEPALDALLAPIRSRMKTAHG
ncbi:MAG: tetraacyldisaccharide 4'-kinase [Hyphomonadaceae bacterium]